MRPDDENLLRMRGSAVIHLQISHAESAGREGLLAGRCLQVGERGVDIPRGGLQRLGMNLELADADFAGEFLNVRFQAVAELGLLGVEGRERPLVRFSGHGEHIDSERDGQDQGSPPNDDGAFDFAARGWKKLDERLCHGRRPLHRKSGMWKADCGYQTIRFSNFKFSQVLRAWQSVHNGGRQADAREKLVTVGAGFSIIRQNKDGAFMKMLKLFYGIALFRARPQPAGRRGARGADRFFE